MAYYIDIFLMPPIIFYILDLSQTNFYLYGYNYFAVVIAKCETQQRPISKLTVFLASCRTYMKLNSFRQDLQDYQDSFVFVQLDPVHPVDPVRK